jgi:hypothetical protein
MVEFILIALLVSSLGVLTIYRELKGSMGRWTDVLPYALLSCAMILEIFSDLTDLRFIGGVLLCVIVFHMIVARFGDSGK